MPDLVVGIGCHEFVFLNQNILAGFRVKSELIFVDSNRRPARIICRLICNLCSDCISRSCNSIWEISVNKIEDLRTDINSCAIAVLIEVIYSELICFDRPENRNCVESFCNGCTYCYGFVSSFMLPVIEYLSFHKRIVRKSGNLIADSKINKVL